MGFTQNRLKLLKNSAALKSDGWSRHHSQAVTSENTSRHLNFSHIKAQFLHSQQKQ